MATIKERVESLISDFWSTDLTVNLDASFASATALVADSVSPAILYKEATDDGVLLYSSGGSGVDIKGVKVLEVTRQADLPATSYKKCHPADPVDFDRAKESNSIYTATSFNPVYTIDSSGLLHVTPDGNGVVVTFEYPTSISLESVDLVSIPGMPDEILQSVALRTAVNALQAYLGWAVQEEEDQEILGLIQNQISSYTEQFQTEMQRFTQGTAE